MGQRGKLSEEMAKARARRVFERVLHNRFPTGDVEVRVGHVEFLSRGLTSTVFKAEVVLAPDPEGLTDAYIIRLPDEGRVQVAERFRREERLLRQLATRKLSFRIPVVLGLAPDGDLLAMVQRFVFGLPLEMNGDQGQKPWRVAGEVAAAIHGLDCAGLPVSGHATRAAHAREVLAELEDSGDPLVEEAFQWGMAHLPAAESARLLHGDLMGQNLLVVPDLFTDEPEPVGVIDWEYAQLGDPAYDLAILTRGVRRPFGVADGFERLLECYLEAGGFPLIANEVRLYELVFVAAWYLELLGEKPLEAEPRREQLRRLLAAVSH